jgi:small-conductance mechanosensitive channel
MKISEKLKTLTKNYKKEKDTIYTQKGIDFINIMYNDALAFTTTKEDAIAFNLSLDKLSEQQINSLKNYLNKKTTLSLKEWGLRVGYFISSFIGLILFLKLVQWVFNLIDVRLSKFEKIFLKKNKNILRYLIPKKTKNIFVFLSKAARIVVIITFLLAFLPFMFSFFPLTEDIVTVFYDYITTPIKFLVFGFIDFIPSLIFIAVIIYFTRYIIRVEKDVVEDIENEKLTIKGFHKEWANPTEKILRTFIYAFSLVLIFPYIPGSSSTAFKGVSIFIGALISFGSTSAIANLIAGIVITYMRPFHIGDRVKIDQIVGDIVERTSLVTRIRTVKNVEVTIPNANIVNGNIINYSARAKESGLILHTTITLGYDVPWDLAEKLLLRAARTSMMIQREPKPFVLQTSLDNNYVSYELNAYTRQEKKVPLIYSDIHRNILDVFNKEGVEILSPSYVSARDGNLTTVPDLINPNRKNPFERIVDHFTGKNQKITLEKPDEGNLKE